MTDLFDPIVIDPPGFDPKAAWQAVFAADPGVCSCPSCHATHWAWGTRQRCTQCGFEYPTDWWSMYSWGAYAGRHLKMSPYRHDERMAHPYYRYGFEHPVPDARAEREKIDWRAALSAQEGGAA